MNTARLPGQSSGIRSPDRAASLALRRETSNTTRSRMSPPPAAMSSASRTVCGGKMRRPPLIDAGTLRHGRRQRRRGLRSSRRVEPEIGPSPRPKCTCETTLRLSAKPDSFAIAPDRDELWRFVRTRGS